MADTHTTYKVVFASFWIAAGQPRARICLQTVQCQGPSSPVSLFTLSGHQLRSSRSAFQLSSRVEKTCTSLRFPSPPFVLLPPSSTLFPSHSLSLSFPPLPLHTSFVVTVLTPSHPAPLSCLHSIPLFDHSLSLSPFLMIHSCQFATEGKRCSF